MKNKSIQNKWITKIGDLTFENAVEKALALYNVEIEISKIKHKNLNGNKILSTKNILQNK